MAPGAHGPNCGCRHEDEWIGSSQCLRSSMKLEAIKGFNELVLGSSKTVFKTYDNRLDESQFCESPSDDCELLIHIPFTSPCKITGLIVIGGENQSAPGEVKIFANNESMDFNVVNSLEPIQTVQLLEDFHGAIEYPLRVTKLVCVTSLTLFFTKTLGASSTKIFYIGIRGISQNISRRAVVTVYEAQANKADHEVKDDELSQISRFTT